MSQLEPLIADLALILICAGVMTLLFKSFKQPIVLGYIVAGFLVPVDGSVSNVSSPVNVELTYIGSRDSMWGTISLRKILQM
jgi:CPA2 family monovalent cation:H+ antiporter-2